MHGGKWSCARILFTNLGKYIVNSHSKEIVKQLLEDVVSIKRLFDNRLPTPGEVRAFLAPVMRRWICHNSLDNVLRHLDDPNSISFKIMKSDFAMQACRDGAFELWTEQISIGGLVTSFCKTSVRIDSQGRFENFQVENPREFVRVNFKNFREQNVLFSKGRFFKRDHIVKFLSDTQGGTHFGVREGDKSKGLLNFRSLMSINMEGLTKDIYLESEPGMQDAKVDGIVVYNYFQILVIDSSTTVVEAILNNCNVISKLIS